MIASVRIAAPASKRRGSRRPALDSTLVLTVLGGALLLLVSVLASRLSSRLGIPALLLFLLIGMLAGSEGPGGIAFDNPRVAMFIGSLALAVILFDGGLQTDIGHLGKPLLRGGLLLSTAGVIVTAAVVAGFCVLALDMRPVEGLLIGAVLSSTDAAAVFSVLRARGVGLSQRLRTLIELESASNDPTAVFLTVAVISAAQLEFAGPGALVLSFVVRMGGGLAIGWLAGRALVWLLNVIDLEHDGLYSVLTLAAVGTTFGLAEAAGTSGFMAVYLAGLTMTGRVFVHRRSIVRFHEGMAWLMQVTMFLVLGLLVFPSRLVAEIWPAFAVSAVLILVARPLAVFVSLLRSGLAARERIMVSWVGLRGAAPIILATFPMVAGLDASGSMFNVVFVAVITSVLLQGPSVSFVARRLGIAEPRPEFPLTPIDVDIPRDPAIAVKRIPVSAGSEADGKKLLAIGGPDRPLVILIRRQGHLFLPTGTSLLAAGDELFVLGSDESILAMRALAAGPPAG